MSDLIYSIYRENDSLPKGHNLQYIKFDLTRAPIDQSGKLATYGGNKHALAKIYQPSTLQ